MPRLLKSLLGLGFAVLAAGPTIAAAADAPVAVASIKPIHSLLAGVMEGVGQPTLLVDGGASPHTWSLRPPDAQVLQDADIVVWVGENLESFLVKPLHALASNAYVLKLSRAEGITLLRMREGGSWDEHDDDHRRSEADDKENKDVKENEDVHVHREDGHEHHGGEFNMHLWLDPANAIVIVATMADALSRLDPERAGTYRENATALQARLRGLDDELKETLAPVSDRGFIVFHDAWQYFDTRYGLRAVGSVTVSPDQAPGAGRLAEIREKITKAKVSCVFAEPQFKPRLVRTLVDGTAVATGTLDPIGAALKDGPDLYFTLMRKNADAFRACFNQ